jgi:hypothetical protein
MRYFLCQRKLQSSLANSVIAIVYKTVNDWDNNLQNPGGEMTAQEMDLDSHDESADFCELIGREEIREIPHYELLGISGGVRVCGIVHVDR